MVYMYQYVIKYNAQEAARWGSFLAKFWVFLSYFTTDPSPIGGGPLQWQPMSEPHYGDENFGSKITGSQDDFLKLLFRLLSVSTAKYYSCAERRTIAGGQLAQTGRIFSTTNSVGLGNSKIRVSKMSVIWKFQKSKQL